MKLKAGEFYGKTSGVFATDSYRFTEKAYISKTKLPAHSHEFAHFCLVLAGNYDERIGSRDYSRTPTALVYYPPDVSHAESHRSSGRHFLVEIDFNGLERVRDCGADLDEPTFLHSSFPIAVAARMYNEFTQRDSFSALALESMTTELLIASSRKSSASDRKPPKWLARAKEYLDDNYLDPPSLTELAHAADVHPTHLARTFRKFEKCTAGEYVRRVRLEEARRRIASTDMPLSEIAVETGFADQSHLSRVFKRETNFTPAEFRRVFGRR